MELNWHHGKVSKAAIVEHSMHGATQKELITILCVFPRMVNAELLRHRAFSFSSSSTRAIPTAKLIAPVRENPTFFSFVGKNQPGMQAKEEVDEEIKAKFHAEWNELARINADYAERWSQEYGIHKQSAGRVLEPFSDITVLITATEWDNFFELRAHEDAQPEIYDLAITMREAIQASKPRIINRYDADNPRTWHLPFVTMEERKNYGVLDLVRASTARCARTSYNNHDQSAPILSKDIELHDKLVVAKPMHASPSEHQAVAMDVAAPSGNFQGGWAQYRKMLERLGWDNFSLVLKKSLSNKQLVVNNLPSL